MGSLTRSKSTRNCEILAARLLGSDTFQQYLIGNWFHLSAHSGSERAQGTTTYEVIKTGSVTHPLMFILYIYIIQPHVGGGASGCFSGIKYHSNKKHPGSCHHFFFISFWSCSTFLLHVVFWDLLHQLAFAWNAAQVNDVFSNGLSKCWFLKMLMHYNIHSLMGIQKHCFLIFHILFKLCNTKKEKRGMHIEIRKAWQLHRACQVSCFSYGMYKEHTCAWVLHVSATLPLSRRPRA